MISKVFFDITNFCNANCMYCFTDAKKMGTTSLNELSYRDIEKLVDSLVKIGVQELSIGGGEPFLRDVCRVFNYVNAKMSLSVTTNGTIITDSIISNLAANNVRITVSVDSINQKVSNSIRSGIDVELVKHNIDKLLQNSTVRDNLSLRTTVTNYNIDYLTDIVDFCEKNKIPRLKINSVNNFGRGKNIDVTPEFGKFMKALDDIIEYCYVKGISTKISLPVEKYLCDADRKCTLGNGSLYIDSSGNLYPCAFSEGKLCWGNITKSDFIILPNDNWNHDNSTCINCPINRYRGYERKTI